MLPRQRPQATAIGGDANRGLFILNGDFSTPIIQISLKMCPFTIRIVPGRSWLDPDRFDNFLDPEHNSGFGSWIFNSGMADRIGTFPDTVTFLLDPALPLSEVAESPVNLLYKKCKSMAAARKSDPSKDPYNAGQYVDKAKEDSKEIPPLKQIVSSNIVMGLVFQKEGKMLPSPQGIDGKVPMVLLADSAAKALKSQFRAKLKEDPSFDAVAFDKGCFVTFFEEGKDPRNATYAAAGATAAAPKATKSLGQAAEKAANQDGGSSGGSGWAGKKYACFIHDTITDKDGDVFNPTLPQELFEESILSWDQMLDYASPQRQVQYLADKFPAGLVVEAMSNHPHWIPETVRTAAFSTPVRPQAARPAAEAPKAAGNPYDPAAIAEMMRQQAALQLAESQRAAQLATLAGPSLPASAVGAIPTHVQPPAPPTTPPVVPAVPMVRTIPEIPVQTANAAPFDEKSVATYTGPAAPLPPQNPPPSIGSMSMAELQARMVQAQEALAQATRNNG